MAVRAIIATTIVVGASAGFVAGKLTCRATPVAASPWMEPDKSDTPKAAGDQAFKEKIQPFLKTYCNSCHNSEKAAGGVVLDVYMNEAHARKDRKVWVQIQQTVQLGEMPPKKAKAQPKPEARQAFVDWIDITLTKIDCTGPKDPGRVTMRRLNRAEYNNTVRDLLGVDFKPANDFPSDDVGYGFDNIGDVLSMQPLMIEKYMTAADKVLDASLPALEPVRSVLQVYRPQNLPVTPRSAKIREKNDRGRDIDRIALMEEGKAYIDRFNFPAEGEYVLRTRASSRSFGGEAPKLAFRVAGKDVGSLIVDATNAKVFETKIRMTAGEKRVEVAFINPAADKKSRVLYIDTLEIEGPLGGAIPPMPEHAKSLLASLPKHENEKAAIARTILGAFATKAFRRPVKAGEIERLMKLFEMANGRGDHFTQALKLPMKAILVSPHFLFRIEEDPPIPTDVKVINEFELATRLSYFLWSSMPDSELYSLAAKGELRKPGMLAIQVKRMLKDPKSEALTENFAGQWLMLRSIGSVTPDKSTFPKWDEALRKSAIRETELFFEHIVKEDRSVLEFLDANYSFLNERLARHYSVAGINGSDFRKVTLPDRRRGGIVTQTSILLVTSNPTRTSPVKRGKWVYENILGLTAPPPAPDVPELPPTDQIKGTVRQVLEQHRSNPSCASCHVKLDPLGFGLENFDAIGTWRDTENKIKVDASGVLPDGTKFNGPEELKKTLLGKADQFRRCLAEKLTTYALGRGLEYYDKCVLDDLQLKLKQGGDKFSALVLGIVESDPFQKRRGQRRE